MTDVEKLNLLKADLEMTTASKDEYLKQLLSLAASDLCIEGIRNDTTNEYYMLEILTAAYMYRKRASDNPVMPRFLRVMRNNFLLKQKAQDGIR